MKRAFTTGMAGVLAAVVLAACGEAASYSAADELGTALAAADVPCTAMEEGETGSIVRSQATCASENGRLGLYVFQGTGQRDDWLQVGGQLGAVAVGPNWVVTGESADAEAAAAALNGRFEGSE